MGSNPIRRWIACFLTVVAGCGGARAAEPVTPGGSAVADDNGTNTTGVLFAPPVRAAWQKHLTLGAGDVLTISMVDVPESGRPDVPVGPDGRISYLQAENVMAAGLTVDELRSALEEQLKKYYQNPRAIVVPVAYRSKHYIVMGAVLNKGVFIFDRPTTVIEAIARAGGLETGLFAAKTVELADLSRSFLVRHGQRMPVDFQRLFQQGDLTQNIALDPGDYLYFASGSGNEIYVLGEVLTPGAVSYVTRPTVLNAIAARGGFTSESFRTRVLVARGSLDHPQTFVINTSRILAGKEKDFPLEPHDIVYVSKSPWVIAGEVIDLAAKSFVTSLILEGSTLRIPPAIK
ncbi:MAG TPA: polysaccharide biosynthesis/export family protein [Candidatus Acidoferrum sp.]|nr:polysaccharide biosynthesis/export family protein [Candidatus Acidoferrum sp.]